MTPKRREPSEFHMSHPAPGTQKTEPPAPDAWDEFNAEMGRIYGELNAACERLTSRILAEPGASRVYRIACELATGGEYGWGKDNLNTWTLRSPSHCGPEKSRGIVFRGSFQPMWMLYGSEAQRMIDVMDKAEPAP